MNEWVTNHFILKLMYDPLGRSRGKLEWIKSAEIVASLIRANSESDAGIDE